MPTLNTAYLTSVLAAAEAPCVSVYLPTIRVFPDSQQNAIRFKNLAKQAEEALKKSHAGADARGLVEKLRGLEADAHFWNHTLDGVVVLASPARFDVFNLPRTMPERAEVGATFHVKPLVRHVQSADPFHVIGVSRDRVALFEGDRYELRPLEVPGIPLTLPEAIGAETTEQHLNLHTTGSGPAQFHGQGGRKDAADIDIPKFFRVVGDAVAERVSEPSGVPLIPAGTEENLAEFRKVSKNRFLTAGGATGDWAKWSPAELREKAWPVFEKHYLADLAKIREDFGTARSQNRGTADLSDAAKAAVMNRIGILLIDAGRTAPGAIDLTTGDLRPAGDAAAGDMLDDLAEMALKTGARVIVTPSASMPTDTGLAAIYRY